MKVKHYLSEKKVLSGRKHVVHLCRLPVCTNVTPYKYRILNKVLKKSCVIPQLLSCCMVGVSKCPKKTGKLLYGLCVLVPTHDLLLRKSCSHFLKSNCTSRSYVLGHFYSSLPSVDVDTVEFLCAASLLQRHESIYPEISNWIPLKRLFLYFPSIFTNSVI